MNNHMAPKQLWDDDAFKKRVRALAEKRGLSVQAALVAAGLDRGWLRYTPKGRMTNHVFRLAGVLGVPRAELLGLDAAAPKKAGAATTQHAELIAETIRLMAAQMAALIDASKP